MRMIAMLLSMLCMAIITPFMMVNEPPQPPPPPVLDITPTFPPPTPILITATPVIAPTEVSLGSCGSDDVTFISAIQGTGSTSPLAGEDDITIEGIVVGDFQDTLQGVFVQEEDFDNDGDPQSSDGIFVYFGNTNISVPDLEIGDVVRIQGDVEEFRDNTELSSVSEILECGDSQEDLATPAEITFPLVSEDALEAYEGMLVSIPQTLTVTEVFNLGRFGEVVLSNDGRLPIPTNVVEPGDAATEQQALNDLNRIVLDDDNNIENPETIPYLFEENTLRLGDTVTNLEAVLIFSFDEYRLRPVGEVDFQRTNPREAEPAPTGGSITVASFNVLNYFNGNGQGGGFNAPEQRGANDEFEFGRQRDKIISALSTISADVVGLMEIENDGFGPDSAIVDLVTNLNDASGETYAFIEPNVQLGDDAIAVAIIYDTNTVAPVGEAATTFESPFDGRRPPLAQTFEDLATGETFTVVVNHFKSKGCGGATGVNADQGDGQGCWNAERVQASETLIEWLASDPTDSGDSDILIIGDLNAYALEEPIVTVQEAGYVNLIREFEGEDAYSYVFFGQAGYLDHALASDSLFPQVTGVSTWSINADEPRFLDYNVEFKSDAQVESLYEPSPFRSSDHDPIIIGLDLSE